MLVVQVSQMALEGPKRVRQREQRFGGRGFISHGHNQNNNNDDDEDEIESVKGVCPDNMWGPFSRRVLFMSAEQCLGYKADC